MSTGAYFGGVAWVDDYLELDDRYIQKAVLTLPGDIITLNNTTQEPESLPAGPDGWVLSADSGNQLGLAWIPPPGGEDIQAGTSGVESGTSGLTITTPSANVTTLALANSGVVANTYGSATQVPVITFDARGRATGVVNTPINVTSLGSIPIRNIKVGDNSVVGTQDSAALGDSAITASFGVAVGSGAQANANSMTVAGYQAGNASPNTAVASTIYGAQAQCFGSQQVAIGSNAISTSAGGIGIAIGAGATSGNNTVTLGSFANVARCTAGGILTILQADDSTAFGYNIRTGVNSLRSILYGRNIGSVNLTGINNVMVGSQIATSVLTTGSANILIGSTIAVSAAGLNSAVVIGSDIIGIQSNSVAVGYSAACLSSFSIAIGVSSNVSSGASFGISIGRVAQCGASSSNSIALGDAALANGQAVIALGSAAQATGQFASAFGSNVVASAARTLAWGASITNSLTNSALIGYDNTTLVRSTGFFKSQRSLSCAAGFIAADGPSTFSLTTPTIIPIKSIRFSYGFNISLSTGKIELGQYPFDSESSFDVSITLVGSAAANSRYSFRIMWEAPGVTPVGGLGVGYAVSDSTNTPMTNMSISTIVNVPAASTGVNTVWADVERVGPGGTLTVDIYRIAVARRA